jgi:hypothetical protein
MTPVADLRKELPRDVTHLQKLKAALSHMTKRYQLQQLGTAQGKECLSRALWSKMPE